MTGFKLLPYLEVNWRHREGTRRVLGNRTYQMVLCESLGLAEYVQYAPQTSRVGLWCRLKNETIRVETLNYNAFLLLELSSKLWPVWDGSFEPVDIPLLNIASRSLDGANLLYNWALRLRSIENNDMGQCGVIEFCPAIACVACEEKLPVVLNIYWFEAENDDGPAVPPVNGEEVTAPAAEPKA